ARVWCRGPAAVRVAACGGAVLDDRPSARECVLPGASAAATRHPERDPERHRFADTVRDVATRTDDAQTRSWLRQSIVGGFGASSACGTTFHVFGPTMPSATRSALRWNARTAASVSA